MTNSEKVWKELNDGSVTTISAHFDYLKEGSRTHFKKASRNGLFRNLRLHKQADTEYRTLTLDKAEWARHAQSMKTTYLPAARYRDAVTKSESPCLRRKCSSFFFQ